MNFQKLVSLLIVTIIATTSIYAVSCPNCVATINNNNQKDNDVIVTPFMASTEISEASYSSDKNSPDYIIPLDDNEPSNVENSVASNNEDSSLYSSEYQIEQNNSIVLIDETQDDNIDANHSILDNQTLYACDDSEHKTLVCDNDTKICECV